MDRRHPYLVYEVVYSLRFPRTMAVSFICMMNIAGHF